MFLTNATLTDICDATGPVPSMTRKIQTIYVSLSSTFPYIINSALQNCHGILQFSDAVSNTWHDSKVTTQTVPA